MGGTAGVGEDALLLVHTEGDAHQGLVVEVPKVCNAPLPVQEFAYVAGEIEGGVVLDGGDGHLLDAFDGQVQIHPVLAVVHVAVVLDFIDLVIRYGRVVHYHDVIVLQVFADKLLIEGLGRIGFLAHELPFGVVAGPGELCGRNAQAQDQHAVDFSQHLHFQGLYVLGFGFPQAKAVFAQLIGNLGAHLGSVVGIQGFRHYIGGDDAVFHHQVGNAGELAAVADGMGEEPVYGAVFHGQVPRVDDPLQEQICLLQLVIEEKVILGEGEGA